MSVIAIICTTGLIVAHCFERNLMFPYFPHFMISNDGCYTMGSQCETFSVVTNRLCVCYNVSTVGPDSKMDCDVCSI